MLHKVLDRGFIKLIDSMGSDLTTVNAARISFANIKEVFDLKDEKLINYLAEHQHFSPFRHIMLTLHIKLPIFVKNQMVKHQIGSEWTLECVKGLNFNEISRRYVDTNIEVHIPSEWRMQSKTSKQCSTDQLAPNSDYIKGEYIKSIELAFKTYTKMISSGVAREQAREVLPLSLYTEIYITGSLQMFANLVKLRNHPTAQKEIQEYAVAIDKACSQVAPLSWAALMKDRSQTHAVSQTVWDTFRSTVKKLTGF